MDERTYKVAINMALVREDYVKRFPDIVEESAAVDKEYSIISNLIHLLDKFCAVLGGKYINLNPAIECVTTGTERYTLTYKLVKTKGSVVGFLGFWLDVDSGSMMIGAEDRAEGIEVFNLYKVLREGGIFFSTETFRSYLEQYKVGTIEFLDLINKGLTFSDLIGSSVRNVILGLEKGKGVKKENLQAEVFTQLLHEISSVFVKIADAIYYLNSSGLFRGGNIPVFSSVEERYPDFARFIRFFLSDGDRIESNAEIFNEVNRVMKSYYNKDRAIDTFSSKGDSEKFDHYLYASSAMMKVDMFKDPEWSGRGYSKSTITLLNVADLLELQDKSDEVVVSVFESSEELKRAIEKVGLKDYFRGARGAALSRSVKNPRVVEEVRKVEVGKRQYAYSALAAKVSAFPQKSVAEIQDFGRTFKILGKVFKKNRKYGIG